MRLVFEKLREHQLDMNREKCSFAQQWINFLVHVIEVDRIDMDKE